MRGDDNYNENRVESVDCFFYPTGHTGEDAVFMALGRGGEPVTEGDSTVYKVKVYFTTEDATAMFGNADAGSCEVFVICNAPLSYTGATSVSALRNMVVENDFSVQTVQRSFLMPAEEPATVTLTTVDDVHSGSGRLNVHRNAAKIQLFLRIPDSFEDEGGDIWEPMWEAGVQIMMSNEVKRCKVDGSYTVQPGDYVSTPYRRVTELSNEQLIEGKEEYTYSHVPFYTYPTTWSDLSDYAPAVVFRIPWHIQGSVGYTWRSYQLSPNVVGHALESNHYYRTFVTVSSLGGADKEGPVIIPDADYIVLDWMNEGASAGGQGVVPGEIVTYKYLVVDHPNVVLNNEETASFTYVSSSPLQVGASYTRISQISYLYLDTTDNQFKTRTINNPSDSDLSDMNITTDWTSHNDFVTISHELEDIYFQWTITAVLYNEDGNHETLTITQNPPIYITVKNGDNAFVNGYFRHVQPAPYANAYAHTATEWSGYYRSASAYRGKNYTTMTAGVGWLGTRNDSGTTYYENGQSSYVVWTPYGNMFSTPGNSNLTMEYITAVHLSSFNQNNDSYTVDVVNGNTTTSTTFKYRIGDPRIANDFSTDPKLEPYLSNMGSFTTPYTNVRQYSITQTSWGTKADAIKIGTTDHDDNNIIAPYFLVNSAYASQIGASGYGITYEQAKKKCATYQEGGYPAGRWRLPTEAEIMYITERQADNSIPVLFNSASGSNYWAASGYYYDAGKLYKNTNNVTDGACRCVYDAWFWGDKPVAAADHVYTPMP
ncbi:MAG: hypothetical protein J5669_00490 [Bacteroidales bacterium]|nr:hypothetical protein [Bacteroidales bacterium]